MSELFKRFNISSVINLISSMESKEGFIYTYESFERLLFHLCLTVIRQRKSKSPGPESRYAEVEHNLYEYLLAQELAAGLKECCQITLKEEEINYIAAQILCSEIQIVENSEFILKVLSQDSLDIISFMQELISFIGNILNVDLNRDQKLREGLALYLRPAIYRLQLDVRIKNPFLKEIKEKYPGIFGATWATSVLFEKRFNIKVNEDEIGFLSLHIGAAIERINQLVKVVMVCNYGIGVSQMISESIKRNIPGIDIISVVSSLEFEKIDPESFSFIISTLPLTQKSKSVIVVNGILNAEDLEKISRHVRSVKKTRMYQVAKAQPEKSPPLYEKNLTFIRHRAKNKYEVIEFLAKTLESQNRVKQGFLQSVMERERTVSTQVGAGIAIPHGNPAFTITPSIAVAILEQPVAWTEEEMVDIVFLLAFDLNREGYGLKKMERFYSRFANLLDDEELISNLKSCKTPEALYEFLSQSI